MTHLEQIRMALTAMHYRQHPGQRELWTKPIGYQMFSFREDRMEWACWFLDMQDKTSLWETKAVVPEDGNDYLNLIKTWECYTKTDLATNHRSHFESTCGIEALLG